MRLTSTLPTSTITAAKKVLGLVGGGTTPPPPAGSGDFSGSDFDSNDFNT